MPAMPGMIIENVDFRKFALRLLESCSYIPIFGEMNEQLEEIVVECIFKAKVEGRKEITLLINSAGGMNKVFAGIKAAMIESGLKFIGLVMGHSGSNGFNLLQQCDKRIAIRDSTLMFHWGSQRLSNSEIAAIIKGDTWPIENLVEDELNSARQVSDRTGIHIDVLKEFALYERRFKPKDAKSLNIIDEIILDLPDKVRESMKSDLS